MPVSHTSTLTGVLLNGGLNAIVTSVSPVQEEPPPFIVAEKLPESILAAEYPSGIDLKGITVSAPPIQ